MIFKSKISLYEVMNSKNKQNIRKVILIKMENAAKIIKIRMIINKVHLGKHLPIMVKIRKNVRKGIKIINKEQLVKIVEKFIEKITFTKKILMNKIKR